MPITLQLNQSVENGLNLLAKQRGLSVTDYIQELVGREAALAEIPVSSGPENAQAFLQWADSFPDTLLLSDEAISRESMYPDRW